MASTEALVIDCDGHILEPPDLWEIYLEPAYRDRALRIRVGDDGFEQLLIDGRPSTIARPGQLSTLGGMGKRVDEAKELRERAMRGDVAPDAVRGVRSTPEQTYLGGAAFGTMDMKERVHDTATGVALGFVLIVDEVGDSATLHVDGRPALVWKLRGG